LTSLSVDLEGPNQISMFVLARLYILAASTGKNLSDHIDPAKRLERNPNGVSIKSASRTEPGLSKVCHGEAVETEGRRGSSDWGWRRRNHRGVLSCRRALCASTVSFSVRV